jgi:hypothetical protein
MTHLTYHPGDRYVENWPASDLDIEDQSILSFLLGGAHSDGSPIWTLDEPAKVRVPRPSDEQTLENAPPQ